jgi:hypothetical protein
VGHKKIAKIYQLGVSMDLVTLYVSRVSEHLRSVHFVLKNKN